jgi:hypothetical protein
MLFRIPSIYKIIKKSFMKNSSILSICLIALMSIIGISCEKNSEEVKFTEVEYGILNMDEFISTITYTDASGNSIVTDDRGQFANGSKKLSVSARPFNARIEIQIYNPTNATKAYTMGILVDGEPKAIKSVYCPPNGYAIDFVEFKVQ